MNLSNRNKEEILDSFMELEKCKVCKDRWNYRYKGKILVLQLSRTTGNGYINGIYLEGTEKHKGWIKIKDMEENEFKLVLKNAIDSFNNLLH
ncbi:hypothetical protein [Serpentinicella alkaliphila]|uniref:Uncharacterized protein n=1 Tax=Serpentinicella alkaliphila TaxID=1734049 RepID=A0A4R2T924_9FIRM|nr:hypothetical protein [Serpentinicella alkaliphila]QUH26035.1 hypothetical protein HZR23_10010 [Serpentinicella alkaliphila]TCP99729.1 hypothetical protein EDD79_103417 [Serpentinicella alkaliphila]